MKDELGRGIMKEFAGLRAKTYSSLMDGGREVKKDKVTKKCVIRAMVKHLNYKYRWLNNEIIKESQQKFKNEAHNVYNEEVNKTALSGNDDKRLHVYDKITTYYYGASRVSETVKIEAKEQKGGFFNMLLGTLGARLLGSTLAGKGVVRAGKEQLEVAMDF